MRSFVKKIHVTQKLKHGYSRNKGARTHTQAHTHMYIWYRTLKILLSTYNKYGILKDITVPTLSMTLHVHVKSEW